MKATVNYKSNEYSIDYDYEGQVFINKIEVEEVLVKVSPEVESLLVKKVERQLDSEYEAEEQEYRNYCCNH